MAEVSMFLCVKSGKQENSLLEEQTNETRMIFRGRKCRNLTRKCINVSVFFRCLSSRSEVGGGRVCCV